MRNPWVIAVVIFSFVAIVGLMVAAAVGLEAVKSDNTDVLLPALIAFGGVSLTLLASTLIPTLIKAGNTEAAAKQAADNSEETRQLVEQVRHEVNGNLTPRLKEANAELEQSVDELKREFAELMRANHATQERLGRGDQRFSEFGELIDAMRAEMAAMHALLMKITSCDVQPQRKET